MKINFSNIVCLILFIIGVAQSYAKIFIVGQYGLIDVHNIEIAIVLFIGLSMLQIPKVVPPSWRN